MCERNSRVSRIDDREFLLDAEGIDVILRAHGRPNLSKTVRCRSMTKSECRMPKKQNPNETPRGASLLTCSILREFA